MNLLRALHIAEEAHAGQYDKGGAPYIEHPCRLSMRFTDEDAAIVAMLHDVIEDSDWTLARLREEGFSEAVVSAVDALTRRKGEDYADFIERVLLNHLAVRVKIEDLRDNSNLSRLPEVTEKDLRRAEKYKRALDRLTPHTP